MLSNKKNVNFNKKVQEEKNFLKKTLQKEKKYLVRWVSEW